MALDTLSLRRAVPADLAGIDRLLGRSYPRLLAPDYPPSTLVLAVPRFARAQPALLASGRYFVAEDPQGRILAAGGWSRRDPGGGALSETTGHVRHVATDPQAVRQGLGRMVMARVFEDAKAAGVTRLNCLSTRTAVPFYRALGFRAVQPLDLVLGPGITFPLLRMLLDLRQK
ncbi:GNAT family N-acetyltransferase [Rhodobacter calidifons]|uniref:GNAT family N-acetyltransferase n=1 Tax=Rhodobacter calidifons TaxID=2715277 RepID=A0ABX0GBA1_9RHOB|nr:GNAT family N-acetyltransferase [Rhodobacter calidifons]NHB78274.1 GNAT family N-acetyltransferase [Rhodobacter calidifons]